MNIINNINYPALNFIRDRIPWDNRLFQDIWTRFTPEETVKAMAEMPEFMREASSFDNLPVTHGLTQRPTAKRVAKWPLFAVTAEDFENLGAEGFIDLVGLINRIWVTPIPEQDAIEIVMGSLWDDMFYQGPKGFDDWLESKGKEYVVKGTMLRPQEGIVEKYVLFYHNDTFMEASIAIDGRNCLWAHINFNGFLSSSVSIPPQFDNVAKARNCSTTEAFFQEDMYNILKYLYYKEHFMLKPRTVEKYDTIKDRNGYEGCRIVTDIPCIIYDVKNCS